MNVTGKLVKVLDTETGVSKAGKEWMRKSFVIDTGAKYNPEICFGLFGDDKVAMIDSCSLGDELTISFNLSSREFKGRYYTQADAWKIEAAVVEQEDNSPF